MDRGPRLVPRVARLPRSAQPARALHEPVRKVTATEKANPYWDFHEKLAVIRRQNLSQPAARLEGGSVPVKFVISSADVTIEAGYQQPAFGLFRDEAGLFARLVSRLSRYGLKLSDMKIERGNGSFGDLHLFCHLLDYLLTVRIRLDRSEIYCSLLTEENKKGVIAAAVETLDCLRESVDGQYRAYAISLNVHGLLENTSAKTFLSGLIAAPPTAAGPVTGNAVAYYFSPAQDRLASSLTFDVSAITPDGLYVRPQAVWDASRFTPEQVAERAEGFVRNMLGSFGLEVPQ